MTGEEKTSYLRIGLGLSGVVVNDFTAEIIWRTVEGLQKKKGEFSVSDQVEIEMLVKGKLEKKKISLEENSKKSERKVLREKHQSKKFGHKNHKVENDVVIDETNKKFYDSILFKNKKGLLVTFKNVKTKDAFVPTINIGGNNIILRPIQEANLIDLINRHGVKSEQLANVLNRIANSKYDYKTSNGRVIKDCTK